jgi:sec-independent protein translocase protein TatB
MFDIGFSELVLVAVVSLLVFGPERLPRVARETALWIRKARSMVASVKSEIDQELQLQDLRQSLQEQKRKLQQFDAASLVEERVINPVPERPDSEPKAASKPEGSDGAE